MARVKILLTGASGQLGKALMAQIGSGDLPAGTHHLLPVDLPEWDITNQAQVFSTVLEWQPDVVINCAGYTDVDRAEANEKEAFRVNALGARDLSAVAFRVGAKMLQISTDYVFDGKAATPRREYHPVNPVNAYGRSKAWGERLVRETNPCHFILRTAWLFGEGQNFVRKIIALSREKEEISVVADQFGTPTSAVDLARCILRLLQTESYGTYHATNEGECSWFSFARGILALTGIECRVKPVTSRELARPAPRPHYTVLENYMLELSGLFRFRHWEEALAEYLQAEAGTRAQERKARL
jgi:dTDP-4-dehydrorhamnose reductase